MKAPKKLTARAAVARFSANLDAFQAGTLSYEAFNAKQIKDWAEVQARPRLHAAVLKTMREAMYGTKGAKSR